jgi:hypothetical protein
MTDIDDKTKEVIIVYKTYRSPNFKQSQKNYAKNNPEKIKEIRKNYYERNKEKIAKKRKEQRELKKQQPDEKLLDILST